MLVTKAEAVGCLLALLFQPVYSQATTVVAIVSPQGIVLAADSNQIRRTTDWSRLPNTTTTKLVVIQDRIAVANIGISDIGDGGVHYYFSPFIKDIQARLPPNVSVDDVASVIQDESAKVFANFDVILESGTLKQNDSLEDCHLFIQYVIAGYQQGLPKIRVVQFYIDWKARRLVGPKAIVLGPAKDIHIDFSTYGFGITQAITDIFDRHSYAYKQALARSPKAFRALLDHRSISLDETSTFARVLIQIEEEVNPSEVAGDVAIIKILPNGRAEYQGQERKTLAHGKLAKQHNP
jgi:hypothetical protein